MSDYHLIADQVGPAAPKTKYVGRELQEVCFYDSLIVYNNGYQSRLKIFSQLGFKPGEFTNSGPEEFENLCMKKNEMISMKFQLKSFDVKNSTNCRLQSYELHMKFSSVYSHLIDCAL